MQNKKSFPIETFEYKLFLMQIKKKIELFIDWISCWDYKFFSRIINHIFLNGNYITVKKIKNLN